MMRQHPLTPNRLWLALALWGLLLIGLVYGRSLSLPFFFDDFVHLPYVDATSLSEMWRTAGSLAYYRPLTFILWKLLYLTLGHHSPVAQHAINLLLHLLNGLLAAQLAVGRCLPLAAPLAGGNALLAFSLWLSGRSLGGGTVANFGDHADFVGLSVLLADAVLGI